MKLPDLNLLLYAYDESSPFFPKAKPWLSQLMSSSETVGFPWAVLLGFIRISTRMPLAVDALSPSEAFEIVENWLAQPNALILHPTDRHISILRGLLEPLGIAGTLTPDAHLAALAIEHGGEVCSADTDFSRFSGVRWSNPVA
jgi:toxin-antitoxin system PIN domain toxin